MLRSRYKEGLQPRCVPCLVNVTEGNCPRCPAGASPSHNICPHACDGPAIHADTAYAAAVRGAAACLRSHVLVASTARM